MILKTRKSADRANETEIGTIRKSWRGRIRFALIYPNRYHLGMSNLGFQSVYRLLNNYDHVVCERAFLPEPTPKKQKPLRTFESGKRLTDADILAFSLSFENDYPHILSILDNIGLPLRAEHRGDEDPLLLAGGVASFINPESIAPFFDCFLMGEAEVMLPRFVEIFEPGNNKHATLISIARNVPGAYVPAFYHVDYQPDGTIASFSPLQDVPPSVERTYLKDLTRTDTCSAILTPDTTFDRTYLIEVGRGCPHGCRFCSAGFIYRPPRFRPISELIKNINQGICQTRRIGLVGSAVSDLPGIGDLCVQYMNEDVRLSFSSLRADKISTELLSALAQSKVKTATIAPDAGSERMRKVINKGITEEAILAAAEALVANGIPNLKLYFMIGLPTETIDDVDAIIRLCKKIKHGFLKSSRSRKRIGEITVSLNCFVPKPFTPFQWVAMDEISSLKKKIRRVKNELKKTPNIRIHSDIPRWAYIQALFCRGDRRVADILQLAHTHRGNWAQTFKTTSVNPDFYVLRERHADELLPWDFIDQGIKKSYLQQEFQKALKAQTSPACRVETCNICGVCNQESQNRTS
ncbi:MAG: TIGR03960 family B12-binding radical SAM protein [Desulfobacterales bacterium]|jgi:radical SAM family uncharacterized protein